MALRLPFAVTSPFVSASSSNSSFSASLSVIFLFFYTGLSCTGWGHTIQGKKSMLLGKQNCAVVIEGYQSAEPSNPLYGLVVEENHQWKWGRKSCKCGQIIESSAVPTEKNKTAVKEKNGDGLHRHGPSGGITQFSKPGISPIRENLDKAATTKPMRSARSDSDKIAREGHDRCGGGFLYVRWRVRRRFLGGSKTENPHNVMHTMVRPIS